jgi:hypothetical protein
MKKIIISFLLVISVCIAGYVFKDVSVTEVQADTKYRFITVEKWKNSAIVYDKETKVMYLVVNIYNGGGVTVLVDENGKPLLYEGE